MSGHSRIWKSGSRMDLTVITEQEVAQRRYWIEEISRLSGDFGIDSVRVEQEIAQETQNNSITKIDNKIKTVKSVADNGILGLE